MNFNELYITVLCSDIAIYFVKGMEKKVCVCHAIMTALSGIAPVISKSLKSRCV
uniref:Uncharacterized protein n=1 Tax=Arundo donax TaxID=35708 RepID=A0A0A9BD73_ARUDO